MSVVGCAAPESDTSADGTTPRWHLGGATLTIGSLEDGDDALSDVASLLVTPWEEVWVLERLNAQVRVFGFDGTLLRTVGSEGDGPGEFRRPGWLGLAGDTVMVGDARTRRTTFFRADGVHAGERPRLTLPEVPEGLTQQFGMPLPGGRDLILTLPMPAIPGEPPIQEYPDSLRPLFLVTTVAQPPVRIGGLEGASSSGLVIIMRDGAIAAVMVIRQPFTDQTLWAADHDGNSVTFVRRRAATVSGPAEYQLTKVTTAGDTVYSTVRAYDPIPLDPALADSVIEALGGDAGASEELREAVFVPAFHPPASHVLAAPGGGTWVGREAIPGSPVVWDIFDETGTLIADIEIPGNVTLHQITSESVWGVLSDGMDVPYVVHYPVLPGGR